MLLGKRANVAAETQFGETPLHSAIKSKNRKLEVIRSLLSHGADVNAMDVIDMRPLHVAAELGDLKIVKLLLKFGADINFVCGTWGRSFAPLHFAVEHRNTDVVKFLLTRGANVNVEGEDSTTPLHIAAEEGHSRIAKHLLDHGASVNSSTLTEGYTPLHLAAKNGHKACVELLLLRGAKVDNQDKDGKTILQLAVENGCPIIVEFILKHSPDINNQSNISSLKIAVHRGGEDHEKIIEALLEYGFTVFPEDANNPNLLHAAVRNGHLKIVEELLKYGADANVLNSLRCTPLNSGVKNYEQDEVDEFLLKYKAYINAGDKFVAPIFYAIRNDDLKMTKLLLANGANVKHDPVLLTWAVEGECLDIVAALLEHGVDVNAYDIHGRTPLNCTALQKNARIKRFLEGPDFTMGEIAKLLLSKGANIEAEYHNYDRTTIGYDRTTLQIACRNGCAKVVEALLEYNANVNVGVGIDAIPLHLSAAGGHEEITTMLLTKGANVNAKEWDGRTALHLIARYGHENLIKTLVKFGADVDSKDQLGNTALHVASENANVGTIITLLQYGSDVNMENLVNKTPLDVACTASHRHKDIFAAFELHIIKLKAASLYVCDKYKRIPKKYYNFQDECKQEIERMKSENIDNTNVSFYDIIVKGANSVRIYLRNKSILQVMESGEYKTKFAVYAEMIGTKFRKGMERKKFFDQCSEILHFLFHNFPELPHYCIETIVNYLNDRDLKVLMDACETSIN